ncbi:MAG: DUF47 family protein [Verrucomicrobiota bacterium]|jgi:uncharacterized protein Yka (UPF0111/DUF47 family)
MFSLQILFGKSDLFYQLLEDAATEAHASVRLVMEMMKAPTSAKNLDDLVLSRRKEKKIGEQITAELVKTFVTGLEREDIEALALALRKIPKTIEKLAERVHLGHQHIQGVDFSRQIEILEQATDVVLVMVKQLRDIKHLEKIHELNTKLQYLENEADRLMMELLKELYSGRYGATQAMVIRDVFELIEKAIDRCRDAGNVVVHIVLKNS